MDKPHEFNLTHEEREVDEYIAAGNFITFDSIEDFLDTLEN